MSADPNSRPIAFLVSTSGKGAGEVLQALDPALARLGTWQHVPHPESSLGQKAAEFDRQGFRPVHLAVGAVHETYLTPGLPNLLLPIWDYPEVPATDLNRNTRMNMARIAGRADAILAPSPFVAEAFRRSGVTTATTLLAIPARAGWSDLATWGPGLPVTAVVPHVCWGGAPDPLLVSIERAVARSGHVDAPVPTTFSGRLKRATKRRLRRVKPYFSNATIEAIDGYRQRYGPALRRPSPARIAGGVARFGYRHLVRRWIGEGAHRGLRSMAERLRGGRPPAPTHPAPSGLEPSPLTLSGLVVSALIDYEDPTTDDSIVSAASHAFRHRPDVTVLIRLVTPPHRVFADLERLSEAYRAPRFEPRCRFVVVAGRPGIEESLALGRATSVHVESARTRGVSVDLTEALASGRPVVAPGHSAYLDWIDESVGFTYETDPEPARWPIDPVGRHATSWQRPVWSDLRDRLVEAVEVAADDPIRYERLSAAARGRMSGRASVWAASEALRSALDAIPARPAGAFAWA